MKISVLSIGTELTIGQILNRNAQWISEKAYQVGLPTLCHLSVPDDRQLILKALQFCSEKSEVLFITGGLGPTSDDFTREVIADWTQRELIFDQASWQHIESRLTARGIPLRDSQKKQCYYPSESRILSNRMGTANAFSLTYNKLQVYVLPGPPKEIEAIWQDYIAKDLSDLSLNLDPYMTVSWDTLGTGESEVAHRVEQATQNNKLDLAYRVHLPYVEVKLSYYKSQFEKHKVYQNQIEQALADICVARNGEDLAEKMMTQMKAFSHVHLIDTLSGSYLVNRLWPYCKPLLNENRFSFSTTPAEPKNFSKDAVYLLLEKHSEESAKISYFSGSQHFSKQLFLPSQAPLIKERRFQYFAEMALLAWQNISP